jgi:hypothetical protein
MFVINNHEFVFVSETFNTIIICIQVTRSSKKKIMAMIITKTTLKTILSMQKTKTTTAHCLRTAAHKLR